MSRKGTDCTNGNLKSCVVGETWLRRSNHDTYLPPIIPKVPSASLVVHVSGMLPNVTLLVACRSEVSGFVRENTPVKASLSVTKQHPSQVTTCHDPKSSQEKKGIKQSVRPSEEGVSLFSKTLVEEVSHKEN